MRNLFLPFTPYQMLLTYAISASGHYTTRDILIPGRSTPAMTGALAILQDIFPDITFRVYPLHPINRESNIARTIGNKKNIRLISKLLAESGAIGKFYYSCDWDIRTTYTSYLLSRRDNPPEFHFIEDGIITYVGQKTRRKNFIERAADTIFYGSWHKNPAMPGYLNSGAIIEALRPDLLSHVYDGNKKNKIRLSPLLGRMRTDKLPDEVAYTAAQGGIDTLIALDSSFSHCNDGYFNYIKDKIEKSLSLGHRIAVKRHPADADNASVLRRLDSGQNLIDLPGNMPIELFYFIFSKTLKEVIGGLGTSVFTAKQLLPHIKAISVISNAKGAEGNDERSIINLFESAGVAVERVQKS